MALNPRRSLDPENMEIPQDPALRVGDGHLRSDTIEVAGMADMVPEHLQLAAFMEEEVEIMLMKVKGEQPGVPVTVTINEQRQHIFRGHPQVIKRKYLEVLARSIITDYEEDADEYIPGALPRSTTSQAYPFGVVRDSAKGISWLQELQRQIR